MNLSQILQEAARESLEDEKVTLSETQQEAVVMDLNDIFQRYTSPCPFEPGDLVTFRKAYNKRGAGQPHIVLEIRDEAEPFFSIVDNIYEIAAPTFGQRLNIRIATFDGQDYLAYWTEHYVLEPWSAS